MAPYGNQRYSGPRRQAGAKKQGTSVRLTGLFASKRSGLYVGTSRPEDIDNLIAKIKEAKAAGKELTFFVWKNDRGPGPAMSLSVDLAQDRPVRERGRAIEEDGDENPNARDLERQGKDNDDPFGED